MENFNQFSYGDYCVDIYSGLKGYVVGKLEFNNGCRKVSLQPKSKEGVKCPDMVWIDIQNVKVLKPVKKVKKQRLLGGANFTGRL